MRGRRIESEEGHTRYETLAHRVAGLIAQGTFRAGDRVPSVRALSKQQKTSITTVIAAYRILEERGVIEARPQSGWYVKPQVVRHVAEPEITAPAREPTQVSVAELTLMVQRDRRNPHLIQLGTAVPHPDLIPSEKMSRALATAARRPSCGVAGYDSPPGVEELRHQIARRAVALGCDIGPEQVLATIGCQEALNLSLRATCPPGGTVALESPTYHGMLQAIESLGLRALEIPTHPRDGMSLDALRVALEENTVNVVLSITNFSNPLGSCIPDAKKRELVALLARHDVPLIEDDVYGDLYFGSERPTVAKAYDQGGRVLLCSSVSKTLAPGFRVGWVMPGRYYDRIEYLKMVTNIASPAAPQLAVADVLANGGYDRFLRTVRPLYACRMEAMIEAIGKHFPEGTRVTCPGGGFVLWVELPRDLDALELYAGALKAGITFAPGPLFSAKGRYRHCLRLNSAMWSKEVERAIVTLGRLAGSKRTA